jgi:hypothetical protein
LEAKIHASAADAVLEINTANDANAQILVRETSEFAIAVFCVVTTVSIPATRLNQCCDVNSDRNGFFAGKRRVFSTLARQLYVL